MIFTPKTDKPWTETGAPACDYCGHPANAHGPISGGCYGSSVRAFSCHCVEYQLPEPPPDTAADTGATPTMTAEQIARVCHEANTAYCYVVGDAALPHWHDLTEDYRQSAIRGVEFTLANASTPQLQHDAWMIERISQGWKYGPVLDREAKIHPNLIPYDQLPVAQKVKDQLFMSIVYALK